MRKFEEILLEEFNGIAKITINRPRYRNAFTPRTTQELSEAFTVCREAQRIRVVLLTGAPSPVPEGMRAEDVKHAFTDGQVIIFHVVRIFSRNQKVSKMH